MDIRVLRYFLAIAREESISRAAEALHVTQPTLSRQIQDLESELGTVLMQRGSRNIALTADGMRLRRRAQEIVDLADRTRAEMTSAEREITGDIHIGGGETHLMRLIARAVAALQKEQPGIRYHLYSGNADEVSEKLDSGLLDFGVLIEPTDLRKYERERFPGTDRWGLLLRKDHPLAQKDALRAADLRGCALLTSRQSRAIGMLADWMGVNAEEMNATGTYNLLYNAATLVEQGVGCAVCLDKLVSAQAPFDTLRFRPLYPALESRLSLVWKKYQVLQPAQDLFLQRVRDVFAQESGG